MNKKSSKTERDGEKGRKKVYIGRAIKALDRMLHSIYFGAWGSQFKLCRGPIKKKYQFHTANWSNYKNVTECLKIFDVDLWVLSSNPAWPIRYITWHFGVLLAKLKHLQSFEASLWFPPVM